MNGIEAGDWPAWIGAALGLTSIGWQILDRLQAWRRSKVGGIQLKPELIDGGLVVVVAWSRAESHTAYQAEVRLIAPAQAEFADVEYSYSAPTPGFITVPKKIERAGRLTGRTAVVPMFQFAEGVDTRLCIAGTEPVGTAFRLSVKVRDLASRRVVGWKRADVTWVPY